MAAGLARSLQRILRHSGSAIQTPALWCPADVPPLGSKVTKTRGQVKVTEPRREVTTRKVDVPPITPSEIRPARSKPSTPSTSSSTSSSSAPVDTAKPPPPPPSSSSSTQAPAYKCTSCTCKDGQRCPDPVELALMTVTWCTVLGVLWWVKNTSYVHVSPAPGYGQMCERGYGCAYHNQDS